VHPLAGRLLALAIALDDDPLGFQRVIDRADDHRHGVERQRARRAPAAMACEDRPARARVR